MGLVTLLKGKTAAVAAPTLITDGVPLRKGGKNFLNPDEGFNEDFDDLELQLFETAYTSGVPAISYARLWGMAQLNVGSAASSIKWFPLGTGTGNLGAATDKGRINEGNAIDGPTATTLRHSERVRGLREFERIALEIGTFTGVWTLEARLVALVVR